MTGRAGYIILAISLVVCAALGALVAWRVATRHPAAAPTPTPSASPSSEPILAASPAPRPSPTPTKISTIIDLPGDPVLVQRGSASAPRPLQVDLPLKIGANAPKVDTPAFYFAAPLVATDGGYMGKFPEGGAEADALAAQLAMNAAVMAGAGAGAAAAASDDDGGDETPMDAEASLLSDKNSSSLAAGLADEQPQIKLTTIKTVLAQKVADALETNGFTRDSAADVEAATKSILNVQTLPPGSVALAAGARDANGGYRVTQFAVYEDKDYLGSVALSENGLYAEGAQPSLPEGALDDPNAASLIGQHFNIADGLYSAGLRSGAPEPVVREAIGLIGALTDVHAPLRAEATMRALYARDTRAKGAAGGTRVIYVGMTSGAGAVDCYVSEGSDNIFRCFGGKSAAPAPEARPNEGKAGEKKPSEGKAGEGAAPPAPLVQTGATSVGGILAPVRGAPVTSLFGMRFHPILHILRLHAGIDFGTPVGSPVRASADGKVEIAGPVSGFGNHIRIMHQGFETSYSHLSEIPDAIKPGVSVKEGDVIALSGNTGLSTGPHLHYEYYLNGVAVDPLPHMGTEVASNIAAGAGEGIVNGAAIVGAASAMPAAGPSDAEVAGFPAFKALVDASLETAAR